jgi:hypothetical protein
MVEIVLEQVLACTIVNVFCNGIEKEDYYEEADSGIRVYAFVFHDCSCGDNQPAGQSRRNAGDRSFQHGNG